MSDADDLTLREVSRSSSASTHRRPPSRGTGSGWSRATPRSRCGASTSPSTPPWRSSRRPASSVPTCWWRTTRCCCAACTASPRPARRAPPSPTSSSATSRSTWRTPTPTSRPRACTTPSRRRAASATPCRSPSSRASRWAGSATWPSPCRCGPSSSGWRPGCPRRRAASASPDQPDAVVRRVAVMGGAGDDLFDAVRASGADVYVTADLRHHPVLEAREEARGGIALPGRRGPLGERVGVAGRGPSAHWARPSASARLGWRPTSPHCAPTRGPSWSAPSRPEVRPESRPVPSVAAARPAGDRHPARPDRPRDARTCRSAPSSPSSRQRPRPSTRRPAGARPAPSSGDVQREVAKAETDVQLVRDRAARNQARLDAGTGTAKDLQAIQHELTSLARRQGELEDVELEVMERAEAAEATSPELEAERGDADDRSSRRARRPATRRSPGLDAEAGQGRRPPRRHRGRRRRRPGRRSTRRSAPRTVAWPRAAAPAPVRRLPARAQQRRDEPHQGGPGRRGAALRGVPPDPGPHRRVRPLSRWVVSSSSRPTAAPGATPGSPATARSCVTPPPAGVALGGRRAAGQGVQQRRGVLRADRRAAARACGSTRRADVDVPDGLQARRRADVGALEDQARGHAPARARGPRARRRLIRRGGGSVSLHVDPAREEQGRRRPVQRRHGRADHRPDAVRGGPGRRSDADVPRRPTRGRASRGRARRRPGAAAGAGHADPRGAGAPRRHRLHRATPASTAAAARTRRSTRRAGPGGGRGRGRRAPPGRLAGPGGHLVAGRARADRRRGRRGHRRRPGRSTPTGTSRTSATGTARAIHDLVRERAPTRCALCATTRHTPAGRGVARRAGRAGRGRRSSGWSPRAAPRVVVCHRKPIMVRARARARASRTTRPGGWPRHPAR